MDSAPAFTANPAARRLGKRIRTKRRALKMTQDRLAEVSTVSQGAISRIERGEMMPSLATLMKLRGALGLPPDEFTEWLEDVA